MTKPLRAVVVIGVYLVVRRLFEKMMRSTFLLSPSALIESARGIALTLM